MDVDEFGLSFGPPFPPVVLGIAHQFLLFRVDRDDGLIRRQEIHGLRIDIFKLIPASLTKVFVDFALSVPSVSCLIAKLIESANDGAVLLSLLQGTINQLGGRHADLPTRRSIIAIFIDGDLESERQIENAVDRLATALALKSVPSLVIKSE